MTYDERIIDAYHSALEATLDQAKTVSDENNGLSLYDANYYEGMIDGIARMLLHYNGLCSFFKIMLLNQSRENHTCSFSMSSMAKLAPNSLNKTRCKQLRSEYLVPRFSLYLQKGD